MMITYGVFFTKPSENLVPDSYSFPPRPLGRTAWAVVHRSYLRSPARGPRPGPRRPVESPARPAMSPPPGTGGSATPASEKKRVQRVHNRTGKDLTLFGPQAHRSDGELSRVKLLKPEKPYDVRGDPSGRCHAAHRATFGAF